MKRYQDIKRKKVRFKETCQQAVPCNKSACMVHFLAPNVIPSWKENSVFVMPKKYCALPFTQHCRRCFALCFKKQLRGLPPKSLHWFLDEGSDAVMKLQNARYKSVRDDIFKNLRKHEIELRLVSRRMVLTELLCRFRGQNNGKNDIITVLLKKYCFETLERWCKWKEAFDRLVFEKTEEIKSDLLFCSGCGNRVLRFTSKMGVTYEKCATGNCDFFHKVGSEFARTKK